MFLCLLHGILTLETMYNITVKINYINLKKIKLLTLNYLRNILYQATSHLTHIQRDNYALVFQPRALIFSY